MAKTSPEFGAPAIFVCDIQERFRQGIHEFRHVVATTQKVLKASKILDIPVFATTQLSGKLGPTVEELRLDAPEGQSFKTAAHCDKTRFSMWTPELIAAAARTYPGSTGTDEQQLPSQMQVALVGIETHICVSQTVRDLVRAGHKVYVLADGVSSCNRQDSRIALSRLRHEGAIVTTSEAWIFEAAGDARAAEFREIAALVKESKQSSKDALTALCSDL